MRDLLLNIRCEQGALPEPGKVSEMLREFAEPLLYVDPDGPADIDTVRTDMMLAMMCWNLPVYEASDGVLFERGKRALNTILDQVPAAVGASLRKLIDDRKTKFAAMPFLVSVEVTGTTLQQATIVAEARIPKQSSTGVLPKVDQ